MIQKPFVWRSWRSEEMAYRGVWVACAEGVVSWFKEAVCSVEPKGRGSNCEDDGGGGWNGLVV